MKYHQNGNVNNQKHKYSDTFKNKNFCDKQNFNTKKNQNEEGMKKINKEINGLYKSNQIIENSEKFQKQNLTENNKNSSKEEKEKNKEKALHKNILNYIDFISPTEVDNQKRILTIDLLKNFFFKNYKTYRMEVFGSFPQNLHLKDSDIDIVISKSKSINYYHNQINYQEEKKLLLSIRRDMVNQGFSSYHNTLFINASVPIVKTKCDKTNINVDIR